MFHDRATVEGRAHSDVADQAAAGHDVRLSPVPHRDVAHLRLVCLVRSGDGYVVRGAGRLRAKGDDVPAQVDISFGDAADRRAAAELDVAVRHIQRWCDLGIPVALLASDGGVTLRGEDGTAVPLPRSAA